MSPEERALHETQVSLERQKRQLDGGGDQEAIHGGGRGPRELGGPLGQL